MRKIAILTDSSADIPKELAAKYGIDVLGFHMLLDDVDYIDGESFASYDEFYQVLRQSTGCPSTAAITQLQFVEAFAAYVDKGYDDVVYASINRTGSSTYDNAVMAVDLLREERPEHHLRIHILDSHTYSMTFGWYLCELARKVRNGAELEPLLAEFDDKMRRMEIILGPYSLKQMKKSGRINAAAAFAGELLGLRPIITLIDGVSNVHKKVRGDDKVVPSMIELCKSRVDNVREMEYMLAYTDIKQIEDLTKLAKKEFGHDPLCVFKLGGVVSCNTGPDSLALVYVGKPRR